MEGKSTPLNVDWVKMSSCEEAELTETTAYVCYTEELLQEVADTKEKQKS